MRSLRRHIKRKGRGPDKKWRRLYASALERAEAVGDPRVQDLKHFADDPEQAVRRLGVISETDLDREFPPEGETG